MIDLVFRGLDDVNDLLTRINAVLVGKPITHKMYERVARRFDERFKRQERAAHGWVETFYPGKPQYPIRWKSEKQRRWFWAMVSKGKIDVPYRRTGQLAASLDVEIVEIRADGFEIAVRADPAIAPHAPYVIGDDQQPFHADTGWPQLTTAVDDAGLAITQVIGEDFTDALYGFISGAA